MIRTTPSFNRRPLANLAGLALLIASGCSSSPGPVTDPSGGGANGSASQGGTTTKPNTAAGGNGAGATSGAAYDEVSNACATETLSASKVYYVCDCAPGADDTCIPGNDSNAGTADAPFQTADKAISTFNTLKAGEAVVLCRGGAWDVASNMTVFNTSCRAGSPCTMRDYTPSWASASTPKPLLTGKGAGHILEFTDSSGANHDEGYRVHNLKIDVGSGEWGVFFYNDVDDVDLCNLEISGGKIGVYVGQGNGIDSSAPAGDGKNQRITVRGSYIHNTVEQGFLGSADTLNVDSNKFDYCGTGATMYLHSIYIDAQGANVHVGNNLITHSTHAPGATCGGAPVVVHGIQDGVVLEYNDIRFDVGEAQSGCWGMTIDAAYGGETEGFKNGVIRGNRITNPGNLGYGMASCDTCVIEDNLVVQNNTFDTTGIAAPNRDREAADPMINAITIRNNTVVGSGSGSIEGVKLGGEGSGHSATNNAIYRTNAGGVTCLSLSTGATSDHNACFAPGAQITLSDAHGVTADPQFTGVSTGDFIPAASSPLHDAADASTASQWAIDGEARGGKPDIGAFEAR